MSRSPDSPQVLCQVPFSRSDARLPETVVGTSSWCTCASTPCLQPSRHALSLAPACEAPPHLPSPLSLRQAPSCSLPFKAEPSFHHAPLTIPLPGVPSAKAVLTGVAAGGPWVIFLLRLSPLVPFNLLNYTLGLTPVGLLPYVGASWVGMLPGTFAYVYLGGAGKAAVDAASGGMDAKTIVLYGKHTKVVEVGCGCG